MRRFARFFRFILSGGLNTAITYGIYLFLLQQTSYQISYSIAYVSGIAISYLLNRAFVFQGHRGLRSILLFPLVYLTQYGFGMLVLWLWIEIAGLSDKLAPLVVVAVTLPVTYILSRFVFLGREKQKIDNR
jgi:putative flippase GtrA